MRRIFLLSLLSLGILSCSNDDDVTITPVDKVTLLKRVIVDLDENTGSFVYETRFFYDAQNRLDSTMTICPTCSFDGPLKYYYTDGKVVRTELNPWIYSRYEYDTNLITEQAEVNDISGSERSRFYEYDNNGNMILMSLAGEVTSQLQYEYNAIGDILVRTEPQSPYRTTYEYTEIPSPYANLYIESLRKIERKPLLNRSKEVFWENDEMLYEIEYQLTFNDEGQVIKEEQLRDGTLWRKTEFFYY